MLSISFADAFHEGDDTVDTVVYNMFTIEQVMAKNLVSVGSSTLIKEVAEILSKRDFHALPVIDGGKLVGIVTTTDLIIYSNNIDELIVIALSYENIISNKESFS
ncbi:hypothetical protein KH5_04590 [Urechidicola sp. KH5]